MKKYLFLSVLIALVAMGCSRKPSQLEETPKAETAQPETQDTGKADASAEKNSGAEAPSQEQAQQAAKDDKPVENEVPGGLNPFKFTVDLDQFFEQKICDEETGKCQSYRDKYAAPEIVIRVQNVPEAKVLYDLDCDGDGEYEKTGLTDSSLCRYDEKTGKKQIAIRGELPGIMLCGDSEDEQLFDFSNHKAVISVDQWGDIRWKTMSYFAANCENIRLPDKVAPNLSECSDLSHVFQGAVNFNQSIGHWDVSHVTNLSYAFIAAFSFNQPLNGWDVSHVTDMSYMFMLCRSFNQPLNGWDVSHVTDMSGMFTSATEFNQPLDAWNVSSVTTMDGMFRGASSFNQPIESWDVSHVTNMQGMFNRATSFNQPIGKWNVTNVRTMNAMFWGATAFKENIDAWDVSPRRDTHAMFQDSGREALPKWYRE